MLGGRSWDEWIAQYGGSHRNPVNRACHMVGIPLIALSIPSLLLELAIPGFWKVSLGIFLIGWALQFVGHAVEGKPPEFLKDPRFLLVGLRWWVAKVRGPRA
jgi:uncharacterized membrane protein YGL010W